MHGNSLATAEQISDATGILVDNLLDKTQPNLETTNIPTGRRKSNEHG
jgi:hypothetical protein